MSDPRTPKTLQEPAEKGTRNVALWTHVLGYDDLCETELGDPLSLEGRAPSIALVRGRQGEPLGFRSPAEIAVPDPWMSGQHAIIERSGTVDVLRDSGSTNGTFINGLAIEERALEDGDLVQIGHSLFCYRLVPEKAAKIVLPPSPPVFLGPTRTRSPEAAALALALALIAESNEPVLILGETGTGKEVVAEALHALSGREGRLCAVHCGAVPVELFESTLFGHVRGAFTGAAEAREGEIERAHGGTLFLDEIATMGLAPQAKLLRVLEDNKVAKVGSAKVQRFDVRWVAATNVELFDEEAGFRSDLLRRLSSHVVRLPPLRRRREDLGALTAHVLRDGKISAASISAQAARRFFSGKFPGNIRDLRVLRAAAKLAGQGAIDLEHLPTDAPADRLPVTPIASSPLRATQSTESRTVPDAAAVLRALTETRGNVVHAARILGTHPRQVYRWIKRYSLSLDELRG